MKPRELRERLFKSGRPHIRPLEVFNEDGTYGRDMGVLWAAYKKGSFDLPEMEQGEFADYMIQTLSGYNVGWMVEDVNKKFSEGRGPVGIFAGAVNEWELEPHFDPFTWATKRNRLKAVVSFLQMMKHDREVGIVNVYSLNKDAEFYKRMKKYGVLYYVGKVPHGDIRGDRHIFFVRGKKKTCLDL